MHFLQSSAWESFQNELGRTTFRRSGDGWSYLAILEPGRFGTSRLYCPYGPTVDSPRALNTAIESLKALAQSCQAMSIRIEPVGIAASDLPVKQQRLKRIDYSSPASTWCIDLTATEDEIVANMNQNNRSIYRNYHKKELKHSVSTKPADIKYLIRLLEQVAQHNNITVHSDSYFKTQAKALLKQKAAEIHLIRLKRQVIAAALVYIDEDTSYYAHAAADHKHRKLNASTALLAEIIIHSKKQGLKVCDLYGITTSDDKHHNWAGFTKFKKSFGGYQVDYNETYEIAVKPLAYLIYSSLRAIKRLAV